MSESKKQQKYSADSIKQRGLHLPPPEIRAEVYHCLDRTCALTGIQLPRMPRNLTPRAKLQSDPLLRHAGPVPSTLPERKSQAPPPSFQTWAHQSVLFGRAILARRVLARTRRAVPPQFQPPPAQSSAREPFSGYPTDALQVPCARRFRASATPPDSWSRRTRQARRCLRQPD